MQYILSKRVIPSSEVCITTSITTSISNNTFNSNSNSTNNSVSKLKDVMAVDGSTESGTARDDLLQISSDGEHESIFVLRNFVDTICFYQCHEQQFAHFFLLQGVNILLLESDSSSGSDSSKHNQKPPNSFLLKSCSKENIYSTELYLSELPSKLHQIQIVFKQTSKQQYQHLVNTEAAVMSCIRSHYSYSQHAGEEDPLLSELNISIRMKPPMGPNGIRFVANIALFVILC